MTKRRFALAFLSAVEKTNSEYFKQNQLSIFDCVEIHGEDFVTVQVIKKDLPEYIKYQIEMMFNRE